MIIHVFNFLRRSVKKVTKLNTTAISYKANPTAAPIAPVTHTVDAVVFPRISLLLLKIVPVPINPIPTIKPYRTCANCGEFSPNAPIQIKIKPQLAIATIGNVRKPAPPFVADSLSQPIGNAKA